MSVNRFTKVCVGCEVELKTKENSVLLVECSTFGFMALYQADLWHCPVCGYEIIGGVADGAVYKHFEQGDIVAEVKRRGARGQRVVLCWLNDREKREFMQRSKEATNAGKLG